MIIMTQQASQMGANAVIGVNLNYEVVRQGMLMVAVSGTAVIVPTFVFAQLIYLNLLRRNKPFSLVMKWNFIFLLQLLAVYDMVSEVR